MYNQSKRYLTPLIERETLSGSMRSSRQDWSQIAVTSDFSSTPDLKIVSHLFEDFLIK